MNYPEKLQATLTQACLDLHHAKSKEDVDAVLDLLEGFDQLNHAVPEWMLAWIVATLQHPLLTAEEHLKLPKPPSPFAGMGRSSHQDDRKEIEQKRLQQAISEAGCDEPIAKKMAALMIADRVLSNPSGTNDGFGGGLGYDWHCHATESQSLSDKQNYKLLVDILQRETAFWRDNIKPRGRLAQQLHRSVAIPSV
jgi:hypothetical protein